jgi:hypothetical protein
LFPWNPEKVIQWKQILGHPVATTTTSEPADPLPAHLRTPQNQRQLFDSYVTLLKDEDLSRTVRTLFGKTAKAFGKLHFERAQNLQQINAQAFRLEEFDQKRRKKIPVDSNRTFTNIESIQAVKEVQLAQAAQLTRRDMVAEARKTASAVVALGIAGMSHQFNLFDPIE